MIGMWAGLVCIKIEISGNEIDMKLIKVYHKIEIKKAKDTPVPSYLDSFQSYVRILNNN